MTLPTPPERYSSNIEAQRNRLIQDCDLQNLKRRSDLDLVSGARIILTSPNGSRWALTVDNAGTLAAVAA